MRRLVAVVWVATLVSSSAHATCWQDERGDCCSPPGGPVYCTGGSPRWQANPGVHGEVSLGVASIFGERREGGGQFGLGLRYRREMEPTPLRTLLFGLEHGVEVFGDVGRTRGSRRTGSVSIRLVSDIGVERIRFPSVLGIVLGEVGIVFTEGRAKVARYHFARLPISILLARRLALHGEVSGVITFADAREVGVSLRVGLRLLL
ncbi:MAG: hypothetical protein AAGE52_22800 [Myxococcota bacterium]